ncbi:hypothetical protein AArcMg_1902 [Natrarchaeobaculum sulfurireducens]|uniref:Uncharacterized protein n=2 Tax=Natrarchaeobaculum sulfurireducens TaxID=2044521 RepID=A0A346PQW4_9EURY|nr:hypothetical protein AArcMg_1902 [Natrarchaeobaculum sulfurireducens]
MSMTDADSPTSERDTNAFGFRVQTLEAMTCQYQAPNSGETCANEATRVFSIYYPERQRQVVNRYCAGHADAMEAEIEDDPNRQLVSNQEW